MIFLVFAILCAVLALVLLVAAVACLLAADCLNRKR